MSTGCQKVRQTDRKIDRAPGRQTDRETEDSMAEWLGQYDRIRTQATTDCQTIANHNIQQYSDLTDLDLLDSTANLIVSNWVGDMKFEMKHSNINFIDFLSFTGRLVDAKCETVESFNYDTRYLECKYNMAHPCGKTNRLVRCSGTFWNLCWRKWKMCICLSVRDGHIPPLFTTYRPFCTRGTRKTAEHQTLCHWN